MSTCLVKSFLQRSNVHYFVCDDKPVVVVVNDDVAVDERGERVSYILLKRKKAFLLEQIILSFLLFWFIRCSLQERLSQ
jgi:hypothetical protein